MERTLVILLVSAALLGTHGRANAGVQAQADASVDQQLARLAGSPEERRAFVRELTQSSPDDYRRALVVTRFLAENLDWTATDYQRRTVEQILERRGGNCAELARVTMALLDDLDLGVRRVREINIHVESPRRQRDAEEKVRESGNRMSVFGRRHNDHVWIEIYDRTTGRWFAADPSLGVVGEEEWLRARLGFGERFSLDPSSADMIAPFAVFAYDDERKLQEDRTRHYVIDGFNAIYGGRLQELAPWPEWVRLVESLAPKALAAFEGSANLHDYGPEIEALARAYEDLRKAFLRGSKRENREHQKRFP